MSSLPTFLDDPRLAKKFGRPPVMPDATGVGMPDPASIPIAAQLDSLLKAYQASRENLGSQMGGQLSALDVLGMAGGGDQDAKTMMRVANQEAPSTRAKLAEALKRKAKFGKGAIP